MLADIDEQIDEDDDDDESGELVFTSVGDPDELIEFSFRLFDASFWSLLVELFEENGLVYLDEDDADEEDGEREAADAVRLS